jgi:hypothetical protein
MAHREIIESKDFTASRLAIELSAKRLDEIMEGIAVALATRPAYFPRVQGSKQLHSLRTEAFPPNVPSYVILFRFDSRTVVLEDIQYAIPDDWRDPLE